MEAIVYILGFGYIALSSCLILYTRATVDLARAVTKKYSLRFLAVLPAVLGLLFVISAPATIYPWVFRIIGLLAFAEAALTFFDPQKIYTRMLDWYFEKVSDQAQRLFGIIGIIFGTAILSWTL